MSDKFTYKKLKEAKAILKASESEQELPTSMLLVNESALEFLGELGKKYGFAIGVEDGNLLVQITVPS